MGRQEVALGSQRHVSIRPWRSTSFSFDGVRATSATDSATTDVFWFRPNDVAQHLPTDSNFDGPDLSQQFFGLYNTRQLSQAKKLEGYYLGLLESDPRIIDSGSNAGDFSLNTFGFRWEDKSSPIMTEIESAYQFGEFGTDTKSAFMTTFAAGIRNQRLKWKPEFWAYFDWASGDGNPANSTNATFQQMFPRGHYYLGNADLFGRQNLRDFNFQLTVSPTEKLEIIIWQHFFWLDQTEDAVYNTLGTPIYQDPSGSAPRYLGNELDITANWKLSAARDLFVGYAHFFTGDYFDSPVIQGGPAGLAPNGATSDDAELFFIQFSQRF